MKIIFTTAVAMSIVGTGSVFGQNLSLGNAYESYKSAYSSDKETKTLYKEIQKESKLNKASLDQNLSALKNLGYFKNIFVKNVNNNDAKILLVIDSRLRNMQTDLDSKILALNNSDWLDSLSRPLPEVPFGYHKEIYDYKTIDVLRDLRTRYAKTVESYTRYPSPVSSETNSKFIYEVSNFNKESDYADLKTLENGLAKRKEQHHERLSSIADHHKKVEQQLKIREQELLDELEAIRIQQEQSEEIERNRQNEISSLPSKEAVKAKFRTYKHRLGYTFDMFPVGFAPKGGKAVTDRVFGRKAMYREVDANGFNTLVIEYYSSSGNVKSVAVFKGSLYPPDQVHI